MIMRNKLERLTDEFMSKHPKATIEEAFRGGYLAHVDELLIHKKGQQIISKPKIF